MKFEFSDYFSPFELFSAIVPGGIGTYIIWTLLQTSPISEQLPVLTGAGAWVAFVISSLILGYGVQPPSHILNIAYDSTYRAYRRRKGDPFLEFAQYQAVREIPTILETGGSVYEWAKTKIQAADPLIEKSIGTIQGISKLFRSLCLFSLIGLIVALWLN